MNNHHATCDPRRVELFLGQQLSDDEQAAFERHLEDCNDCLCRLQAAAAGDAVWSEVREALLSQPLPPDCRRPDDSPLDSATGVDTSFGHATILKLLAPTDDDRMIGHLGTYEVVGVIGSGGMGVVLKAFDAALNRYVAIKVLAPHLGSSGAARRRFSREAQAAAAVVHDHVMEIYGVADVEGLPYLVMPYVRGPSLQRRLDGNGPLALVEILRIGMQAAAGLAAAHAQGLVHRDVKPANILLADGVERVKLTDFGLARAADDASLTKTGVIAGTPQYMSPEQARGESVDQRSDLFSLGSVLYAMCTGRAPFRAETSYGVLRRVTDDEPRPIREINPGIPEWLCRIIARLMSKRPGDRFASAREVAELLEECLAHIQQPTAVPLPALLVPRSKGGRFFSISRRSSGAIVMISALGLGLLGMVLGRALEDPDPNESPSTPPAAAAQTQPGEPPAKAAESVPRRIRHFADLTIGNSATIACSPDGRRIAIANGNPTIVHETTRTSRPADNWTPSVDILDAETGKIVVSLKLSTAEEDAVLSATERVSHLEATALDFSSDGSTVAVGTNIGQVKLFNARSGELVRSLDDEAAKLEDTRTPENWKTLRRAMGNVASLDFSADGTLLAMCGGSFADFSEGFDRVSRMGFRRTGPGRLKVWDVQTGTLKHDLVGHNDHAYAVAFSPDGRRLASAGRWHEKGDMFGNGVILWDPHSGKQIHRLIRTTADAGVRAVAFSPDSKLLALGEQRFGDSETSTGAVSMVQVSSGVTDWLVTVPGWAKPMAFLPDGESVAVLCGGQSIRFLATDTGTVQHEIRPAAPSHVRWSDFAIAPQGLTLAIAGVDQEKNGSVDVWSARSGGNASPPASASSEGPATDASDRIRHLTTPVRVGTVASSADGLLVAVANGGPALILQENGTSRVKGDWKPSADILDAGTGKTVVSLKLTTAEEDAVLAATERVSHLEVTALAISPDGRLAAVGTSTGQVKLFDARSGELVRSLDDEAEKLADRRTPQNWKTLRRAMGSVASLDFSPDGSLLAMCGESFADFSEDFDGVSRMDRRSTGPGRLKLWDVQTATLKQDLVGHSHANAVAFSPDGTLLASAGQWLNHGATGTGVVLWDVEAGTKHRTISTEDNGGARFVAFSPNGALLAVHSLYFDADEANAEPTDAVSVAPVASGVVKWRRTMTGLAKPVAFFEGDHSLLVLRGGRTLRFLDADTGQTQAQINRSAVPHEVGRWNAIAVAKRGRMLLIGGVDDEGKGNVAVWDFDHPDPAADPASATNGEE